MSELTRDEAPTRAGRRTAAARTPGADGPHAAHVTGAHARSPGALPLPGTAVSPAPAQADRDGGDDQLLGAILGGVVGAALGVVTGGLLGGVGGAIVGGLIGGAAGALVGAAIEGAGGAAAGPTKSVTVNVTRLNGVTDTTGADVARANVVYRQANVTIGTGKVEELSAADSTAILGADGALDNFTSNTLTAEETTLVAHNRTPGRITAYYVPKFKSPTLRGEAIRPSRFGVADPSVVVGSTTRVLDTLAHELGHALTNDGSHPSDASNLMARGAVRNFTDNLTQDQIDKIRNSPYAR